MQITTSKGSTFKADWTLHTMTRHGAKQLIIQLPGTIGPSEILLGMVGADEIKVTKDGVTAAYDGYTLLSSIIYTYDRSAVRVALEKGDAA